MKHKTAQVEEQKRELKNANIQLKKPDRQKNLFYQNITHELRTPIILILGPLESLIHGFAGPFKNEIKSRFVVLQRNTGRLLQYINQLLELSKLETGKVKPEIGPVDLGKMIKYVAAMFESSFKTKEVSLAILDLKMPYISGEELLKQIKEEYPETEVLVVTGIDTIESAVLCTKQGSFEYLVKRVDIRRLLSEIRHIKKIKNLEH